MKKRTILRVAEWIIILPLAYYSFQYVTAQTDKYIRDVIDVPQKPFIHVDQNKATEYQNGSFEYPFAVIESAFELYSNDQSYHTIFIHPGEYVGALKVPDEIRMFGFNGRPLIKNPDSNRTTMTAGKNLLLANIAITDGKYGLYIPLDTSATLLRTKITHASIWGIFGEKHTSTDAAKLSIISSDISHNARQGLYLKKGTFYMNNSSASHNGEEGVDLHVEMNSKIINSTVNNNGEGGLETELGNIELLIENSNFFENGASGVNLQSSAADSTVVLNNNSLTKNSDFGVRCAIHKGYKRPYFVKMVNIKDNNKFSDNGKDDIDPNCSR